MRYDKFRSFVAERPWKWSASGIAETRRRGNVVCQAIDSYRAKTGRYPTRLEDLQPDFLREVPQPTVGDKEWDYILIDQGTDYWLRVSASEFGQQLGKTSRGWEYMDKDGLRNI